MLEPKRKAYCQKYTHVFYNETLFVLSVKYLEGTGSRDKTLTPNMTFANWKASEVAQAGQPWVWPSWLDERHLSLELNSWRSVFWAAWIWGTSSDVTVFWIYKIQTQSLTILRLGKSQCYWNRTKLGDKNAFKSEGSFVVYLE